MFARSAGINQIISARRPSVADGLQALKDEGGALLHGAG
jgi:hypothetical protein